MNDKMHGKGKKTWFDGDVYEGEFMNDKMHGKGKKTWFDGDVYEGELMGGKSYGKEKKPMLMELFAHLFNKP